MKRFLSFLTVFMLAFALAVPVGAANIYPDRVVLPDGTIVYESYDDNNSYLYEEVVNGGQYAFCRITNINNSEIVAYYQFSTSGRARFSIETTGVKNTHARESLELTYNMYDVDEGEWSGYNTITLASNETWTPDIMNASTKMTLIYDEQEVLNSADNFKASDSSATLNTYEVVVKHSDSLTLKYSYTETLVGTSFNAVYNDDRITVSFDNPVNHYQYKLIDGEWELSASYPNTIGSHVISLSGGAVIQSSDIDIYDESGELFFQNPLWVTVEMATQGMLEILGGTMKVLVPCGVGLMASLVVLSLFGKRSLIFLR